jgi:hypothetical protein
VLTETRFTVAHPEEAVAFTTPYLFAELENGAPDKKGLELSETPQFDKKASKKRNLNRGLLCWNGDKRRPRRRR